MHREGLARPDRIALDWINGDQGLLLRTVLPNVGAALPFMLLVLLPVMEKLDVGINSRFPNLPSTGAQFRMVLVALIYINTSSISFFSSSTGDTWVIS